VAIDLPGAGARADEDASLGGWIEAILAVTRPDDVIVGHSMGGAALTLAANAAPERVRHLIYLAAMLPVEGVPLAETMFGRAPDGDRQSKIDYIARSLTADTEIDDRDRVGCADFESTRRTFYDDCDTETAGWAYERLRPMSLAPLLEVISVPGFWNADLPRSYIRCLDDCTRTPEYWAHMGDRLGGAVLTIEGSHSPFLSRPGDLAEAMLRAIDTTPTRQAQPR
jgi:pimeloyl-ACP methyl ester carboxylesterase